MLFGLPNDAIPAVAELPLLMEIRRRFAYGTQHDYLDQADLAGWTREGDPSRDESGVAVVLCNRPASAEEESPQDGEGAEPQDAPAGDEDAPQEPPTKRMYVGAAHAGEAWRCVLGDVAQVTIDEDGTAAFAASDASMVAVYVPEEAANRLDHIPIVMGG